MKRTGKYFRVLETLDQDDELYALWPDLLRHKGRIGELVSYMDEDIILALSMAPGWVAYVTGDHDKWRFYAKDVVEVAEEEFRIQALTERLSG